MRTRTSLGIAVLAIAPALAFADDYFWAAPLDGYWSSADNWLGGVVPAEPDADVLLDVPGDYTVTVTNLEGISRSVNSLSLLATGAELVVATGGGCHMDCTTGLTLTVAQSIVNDGHIIVPEWYFWIPPAQLDVDSDSGSPPTISGSGAIILAGGSIQGNAHQMAGHTIEGAGHVELSTNDGTIRASAQVDYMGEPHASLSVTLDTNNGLLETTPGAHLGAVINTNNVPISLPPNASMYLRFGSNTANVVGDADASLTLGECHNASDVLIDAAGASLDIIGPITGGTIRSTPGADALIRGNVQATLEGEFTLGPDLTALRFTNNAVISIPSNLELDEPCDIDGVGEIRLLDNIRIGSNATAPSSIGAGQTIAGEGRLRFYGPCSFWGDFEPGDDDNAAQIYIFGAWTLHPTSDLRIDIFSHDDFDTLRSGFIFDNITLDGDVTLRFHAYVPALADEFPFFTASPRYHGGFDTLHTQGLNPAYKAVLIYRGLEVVARIVSATCPADLDQPEGVLDFADVLAFLVAFANAEPPADLAPPLGVYDFSDVFAYLTAFAAGCP
ncbi:MAG: GC-type dockerin domain-anchored protein [Phycisphaerales bacterium]